MGVRWLTYRLVGVDDRVDSNLRAAAYRMAVVGVQPNPAMAAQHARERAVGKSKPNALDQCMRKALSPDWGVWAQRDRLRPNWRAET